LNVASVNALPSGRWRRQPYTTLCRVEAVDSQYVLLAIPGAVAVAGFAGLFAYLRWRRRH
jgi:hypothetical protein